MEGGGRGQKGRRQTRSTVPEKETGENREDWLTHEANASANANASPRHEDTMSEGESGEREESVSELILRELRDFRHESTEQLKEIREDIKKTNNRLEQAEDRIEAAETRIQSTEDVMTSLLKLQTQLEARITDQEGRSRRENIRIYGVKEGAEGNPANMAVFVEGMLREKLGVEASTAIQIERAHRALAPRPPDDSPPRSIVVKFLSYRTKEHILRLAWQKRGFLWQDRRVNIDHDYAPAVLRQRKDYTEAKKILKEKNIKFQTPFPARLRVFYPGQYGNEVKLYDTAEEATKDMAERGIQVAVIKPPETLIEQIQRLTWQTAERPRGRERTGTRPSYREKLSAFKR